MRRISLLLAFASVCLTSSALFAQDIQGFEARNYQGTKATLPYRLFKVKNPEPGKKYPLILFLHGAGERGTDNAAQLNANAGATAWATDAHQAENPAYVIAPQCPADEQWVNTPWAEGSYVLDDVAISDPLTTALEIVDAVAKEFDTDPTRLYITGLSMGGFGTWDSIMRNPTRFAAALPVCGSADPSKAPLLKELPIWTFHGDADNVVPPQGTRDMVQALKDAGSSVKYTEYPGRGHDSWVPTYADEAVIDWLFTNQNPAPGAGGSAGAAGMAGAGGAAGSGGTDSAAGASAMGGSTSGSASAGMAGAPVTPLAGASPGTAGNGSGNAAASRGDDSSCSFVGAPGAGGAGWALLGGFAGVLLLRRRRANRVTL